MAISAKDWKGSASLLTVGLEIALGLVLGLLLGQWLDRKYATAPIFSVLGFALGFATAVKAILRTWREMQRITEREEQEQGNPKPRYEEPETSSKDEKGGDFFAQSPPAGTDDEHEPKR